MMHFRIGLSAILVYRTLVGSTSNAGRCTHSVDRGDTHSFGIEALSTSVKASDPVSQELATHYINWAALCILNSGVGNRLKDLEIYFQKGGL